MKRHSLSVPLACCLSACDTGEGDLPTIERHLVFDVSLTGDTGADTLIVRFTVLYDGAVEAVELTWRSDGARGTLRRPCTPSSAPWTLDVLGYRADGELVPLSPTLRQTGTAVCGVAAGDHVIPVALELVRPDPPMVRARQGFFDIGVLFDGGGTLPLLDITVESWSGRVVWHEEALDPQTYGNPTHSVSYVGPCDASAGSNEITVTVSALRDADGAPVAYPSVPTGTVSMPCREDQDIVVSFGMTIARWLSDEPADGVVVGATRCRPAVACHDGVTSLELACDVGQDAPPHVTTPETLLLEDLQMKCPGERFALDPTAPGVTSGPPGMLAVAEPGPAPAGDLGWRYELALAEGANDCVVTARAAVVDVTEALGAEHDLVVLPSFVWEVPLDNAGTCAPAALGQDERVRVDYVDDETAVWTHARSVPAR